MLFIILMVTCYAQTMLDSSHKQAQVAACECCVCTQASTQQVFRDLLSRMGDQGRKKLTILLLGAQPSEHFAIPYCLL